MPSWSVTVATRRLDMLRTRTARREDAVDDHDPAPVVAGEEHSEGEAVLADSVGLALLVVLDPDAATRADATTVAFGSPTAVHGAAAVAETFCGRAKAARVASRRRGR